MLYFIYAFFIISFFLLFRNNRSRSTKYLISIFAAYTMALLFVMLYLSKDAYYYNSINNYFSIPAGMWSVMMFMPINRDIIISFMNISMLLVLFFSIRFAFSFRMKQSYSVPEHLLIHGCSVGLILEAILFQPSVIRLLYCWLYPNLLTAAQFNSIYAVIQVISKILNISILTLCIGILIFTLFQLSPLRLIRMNMTLIALCYILFMVSYIFIFGNSPQMLIRISYIADYSRYLPFPLQQNPVLYQLFPYYLICMLILTAVSIYHFANINTRISEQSFSLSKEIASSDATSRVFCHYMKNELLAIQSAVEMLEVSSDYTDSKDEIIGRCDNLYNRLDIIHRSTKASELNLTSINLPDYIQDTLSHISYELADYHVVFSSSAEALPVMIDPNYFEQALHNIYLNAISAMKELPPERKNLTVRLETSNNWVVILVEDTGVGIEKENLTRIFQPFYSSAPVAKHWGIGLSLTHKIITAHEGFIEAESTVGKGTIIKIMLPRLISVVP